MLKTEGISASPGLALGKALIFRHDVAPALHDKCRGEEDKKKQYGLFEEARSVVASDFDRLIAASVTKEENDILFTHRLMVEDPEFASSVKNEIEKENKCAAWAVESVMDSQVALLSSIDNVLFKERIADIKNVSETILRVILKEETVHIPVLTEPSVIVADYLTPAEIVGMDKKYILGFALISGGKTSHVAVLAHSLNIPCLVGITDIFALVKSGDTVALDAGKGRLAVNPEGRELEEIRTSMEKARKEKEELASDAFLPAITSDGHEIKLRLNISGADNLDTVFASGAEGVGLFRTEFLMMDEHTRSEEEAFEVYKKVASASKPYGPVTIRTLDVGGDKVVDSLSVKEENPILGWRAVRFCLANRELFASQLRSILRASVYGKVKLMFPMISGLEELEACLDLLDEVKTELRTKGIAFDENIPVGIMIEVPGAALCSDLLAKKVDFFSVGTNDLVQYTLAVDRGNEKIAYLYNPLHPGVLRLLKLVVDNAHKNKIKCSMCGEMASVALYVPLLAGLGFDELSMNSQSIAEVRRSIRSLSLAEAEVLAEKVLTLESGSETEKYIKEWTDGKTGNNQ
jgi:phosphoenolpyruvate-protein phosphotransferase